MSMAKPVPGTGVATTGDGLAALAEAGQAIAAALNNVADKSEGAWAKSDCVVQMDPGFFRNIQQGTYYTTPIPILNSPNYCQLEFRSLNEGAQCTGFEMWITANGNRVGTVRFEPWSRPTVRG